MLHRAVPAQGRPLIALGATHVGLHSGLPRAGRLRRGRISAASTPRCWAHWRPPASRSPVRASPCTTCFVHRFGLGRPRLANAGGAARAVSADVAGTGRLPPLGGGVFPAGPLPAPGQPDGPRPADLQAERRLCRGAGPAAPGCPGWHRWASPATAAVPPCSAASASSRASARRGWPSWPALRPFWPGWTGWTCRATPWATPARRPSPSPPTPPGCAGSACRAATSASGAQHGPGGLPVPPAGLEHLDLRQNPVSEEGLAALRTPLWRAAGRLVSGPGDACEIGRASW